MEFSTWLVYLSVVSMLIFSPGPSALLCISDGIKFGNKKTLPTVLGGAIAALLLMSLSAVGLGAVLVASETLFFIIKILGATYLIYLGANAWRQKASIVSPMLAEEGKTKAVDLLANYSGFALFRKGFMVGISNPKDLLFFIALFPSFMNADLPQVTQYLVLASTWFVLDCTAMFVYAGLGTKARPFLNSQRAMRIVNRATGSMFIVLGSVLFISVGLKK
jgi:threonine/homoserine/homoserine lactone efflux protein